MIIYPPSPKGKVSLGWDEEICQKSLHNQGFYVKLALALPVTVGGWPSIHSICVRGQLLQPPNSTQKGGDVMTVHFSDLIALGLLIVNIIALVKDSNKQK
jgi:hypothetical protein